MTHTPAPWVAYVAPSDTEKSSIDIRFDRDDRYEWVASVHTQFEGRGNGEANARLIASAPSMYDLLKSLHQLVADNDVQSAYKIEQMLNSIDNV